MDYNWEYNVLNYYNSQDKPAGTTPNLTSININKNCSSLI